MDATGKIKLLRNAKGMTIVFVAVALVVLIGVVGLVVDLGHMQVVRGELQNAADAAALAGAASLYTDPITPTSVPNWTVATAAAQSLITKNKSDNNGLQTGEVDYGYWNTASSSSDPSSWSSTQLTSDYAAAIRVTVTRSGTSNNGPVSTTFMKILNVDSAPVSSRPAVAIMKKYNPGFVPPNSEVFPFAICKAMTDTIFAAGTSLPTAEIYITSAYSNGDKSCLPSAGQWTSLAQVNNSASNEKDLIKTGNNPPLAVGDSIYIQPGQENSVYNTVIANSIGKEFYLPIIDTTDLKGGATSTIVGFAYFHITGADNGSGAYIKGYFTEIKTAPSTFGPGGSISNVTVYKPSMAQ